MINGSIKERIAKRGKNKNGQMKENLKLYDVYYRYCDPVSGKTHQTTKRGFFTKGEASAFLLKVNVQMLDNNFAPVINITTGEYIKEWFETYVKPNLRPYTIEAYKRNIYNHILPYVGNIELQKLSASNIEALYAKLSESGRRDGKGGLSQKYILHIHRVLTEALEHAAKKRLISRNPAKDISSTPKPKKFKAGTLTSNQVNQVLMSRTTIS